MKFTGEFKNDTNLQSKALRDINSFLSVLEKKNTKKLYKIAQLSWKRKSFWKKKHSHKEIVFPASTLYELQEIILKSRTMIDAKILFISGTQKELRKIRFIAEKKRYVTNPDATFRFNPTSMLRAEVKTS